MYMIDFIGIGAQKSGTSWVYACLYEHPQICAPIKEIHFFSRQRFEKGRGWYEEHFSRCDEGKIRGEFSTSYLYSEESAERIKSLYPQVKLIAILRNPIHRAYSQYGNAIKAGEIPETMTFEAYGAREKSVMEQGLYMQQLARYRRHFSDDQMLVLIYEDIEKDPRMLMRRIYTFLGVDAEFVPTMIDIRVNVARVPKMVSVDRMMHHIAERLRVIGLDRFVWAIRTTGLPDLIRRYNTKVSKTHEAQVPITGQYFLQDAKQLSVFLNRDMVTEWKLNL